MALCTQPDNGLQRWQEQLLCPATARDVRAAALRDHLPLDSPWRKSVLRHDARLWELFPAECAAFRTDLQAHHGHTSDVERCDGNPDSDSCTASTSVLDDIQQPLLNSQLQSLAADVCTRLAVYACASSLAAASICTDVAAKDNAVQALVHVRTMLRQFDDAAAKHEAAARCALESARTQQQAMHELALVVQQAAADVERTVMGVQSAVESGSRDEVESAVTKRGAVRSTAVDGVHTASLKCVECGMDATFLEDCSTGRQARAFLDQMEDDADTDATTATLVQVGSAARLGHHSAHRRFVTVGVDVAEVEHCG